jgi:hypothetical protein
VTVIDRATDRWLEPLFQAADPDDLKAVNREMPEPRGYLDWIDYGYRLRSRIGWDDRHPDHPEWPWAGFTRYMELRVLRGKS